MKKFMSIFTAVLFLFALTMSFSSCGGGDGDDEATEETSEETTDSEICELSEEMLDMCDEFIEFVEDEKRGGYSSEYLSSRDKREAGEMLEEIEDIAEEINEILEDEDIIKRNSRKRNNRKIRKFYKECGCEDVALDIEDLSRNGDMEYAADVARDAGEHTRE